MALIKRIVYFQLPVEFRADTLQGLRKAIKGYREDPSPETYGCGESGYYSWRQLKPILKRKAADRYTDSKS